MSRRDLGDLAGRVTVVTGACSGIGLSVVARFARAGARVVGLDRDAGGSDAFHGAAGADARLLVADVADLDAVEAAFATAEREVGPVHALVNSAGIRNIAGVLDVTSADWQRVLDVNLTGTFHCCRAVAGPMVRRGHGSIVNISSISGLSGFRQRAAYTVSKHGVNGLTKTLAGELGEHGVRVNAICPGLIDTPLTAAFMDDPEVQRSFRSLVPAGRVGRAEEIADVALFLAGDGSSFVTGVALPVDGGVTAVATYDATGASETFGRTLSVVSST